MGEKFSANPVTGTGSMSVPIFTSPGRSGFGPQLSLSYDSGAGNGPFGWGWSLSVPSITRKTDKGLPTYRDAEEFDDFILSGAEDLVPALKEVKDEWEHDVVPTRKIGIQDYEVRRYHPRTEGLFARIERWINKAEPEDTFWRSISKDNITTWYGKTDDSRIVDPTDPAHVFSWLICESYDDKGNAIRYEYVHEDKDPADVDLSQAHERNRTNKNRSSNRYLKRVKYGNRSPNRDADWKATDPTQLNDWMFEVVFDYGEGHYERLPDDAEGRQLVRASIGEKHRWTARQDPFSSYRAGFEVRTYRLCRRMLMFQHFPNELGTDDYLVRSTDFTYEEGPLASFITRIAQSGYVRNNNGTYLMKSLPPLEFEYSQATVQEEVREVDPESLENLPHGLDGSRYQWLDLDGEGVSGILTEQAGAWFYKRNLSPLSTVPRNGQQRTTTRFGPIETVARKPSLARENGGGQFLDLAGDGSLDFVQLGGPVPGFYERTYEDGWDTFTPFRSLPVMNWEDPNLRFVDLTGDGHADVLITEGEVFAWHPSLAEAGFGPEERTRQPLDEERGPRLVFADGTQSIHLADCSGDGLTDLMRIRNGDVCYWPNLGYGRFGAKVTMDDAPWFDAPDLFDQRRVHLADIDGSGVTDIIYVGHDSVHLYFNQSGNSWSEARALSQFPRIDDLSSVTALDLLGNGTACLVWSSPLPANARRPMRYVDLMGSQKPHLLVNVVNNLGAETRVEYAPSTRFYLADKVAGKPWITKLPFPVHVVEQMEIYDHISRNRFVTRYAYHHGYFDGIEREFRGFGMVEQWDTEEIGTVTPGAVSSEATNLNAATYAPPVLTKTWFHTGVYLGRDHISDFFAGLLDEADLGEYYREPGLSNEQARELLLVDTELPAGLSVDEEREASRALKGSMLRQEVYALDGTDKEQRPYTVTEQNFTVRRLQPKAKNRHAVFFTHARESISYHYERNPADPRIAHALTLEVDEFGNVLKSAAVGYGRRKEIIVVDEKGETSEIPNPDLNQLDPLDQEKQIQTLITYTENRVTDPIDVGLADDYRTPLPCETRTYELTGYTRSGAAGRFQSSDFAKPDPSDPEGLKLVHAFDDEIDYEAKPTNGAQRRLIEHVRTLYRKYDLTDLLGLGILDSQALPGETYKLAFTPGLLTEVYKRPRSGQASENLLPDLAAVLPADVPGGQVADRGGYLSSQTLRGQNLFPASAADPLWTTSDADGHWWTPTGRMFYSPNSGDTAAVELIHARQHFYLPWRYRDPFGQDTTVTYDDPDLLMVETRDPVGNRVTVGERDAAGSVTKPGNDYRVLQPKLVSDPNRNRTAVSFDALGMVVGTAVMGKPPPAENLGDSFQDFEADLTLAQTDGFYEAADPHAPAAALLKGATTRIIYDLDRFLLTQQAHPDDPSRWQPVYAATLARETHMSDQPPPGGFKVQIGFSYSDGFGREIQKKIQAEPGPLVEGGPPVSPRWVGSGWTIFNNKGKPIRQYEPFFSQLPDKRHRFEFGVQAGVSPILFYDPVERVVATLHPNHSYEKVVFDPWRQTTYDVNDTVAANGPETGDPRTDADIRGYVAEYFKTQPDTWQTWHQQRIAGTKGAQERSAAEKAAEHANTPTTAHFDTLGRPFLTLAHNGFKPDGTAIQYPTRVRLDIEGNQREVRDAIREFRDQQGNVSIDELGRIVMLYDYDLLGNRIHQRSMEAGRRWMLNDVTGKPIRAWDTRGHNFTTAYDTLRRPVEQTVRGTAADSDPRTLNRDILVDKIEYGEPPPNATPSQEAEAQRLNLRTRIYRHFDSAGIATNARLDANGNPTEAYDFKGNLLGSTRRLVSDYTSIPDWLLNPQLDAESFEGGTRYDALNRPIQSVAPHSNLPRAKRNVIQPVFNEANLLEWVDVWLERAVEPGALLDPNAEAPSPVGVANIDYDAKGQRLRIDYKNGTITRYRYDPDTFRLVHLYTRRGGAFTEDCDNLTPTPSTIAAPEIPPQGKACGLQNLHYTYDPAGNITHIQDDAQQTIYFENKRVEPSNDYTYDALYRLIQATGREHLGQDGAPITHSHTDAGRVGLLTADAAGRFAPNDGNAMGTYIERYVYDAVGNFLQVQHRGSDPAHLGWTRAYDYLEPSAIEDGNGGAPLKTGNRLTRTTLSPNGPNPQIEPYQHDAHGNMVRMPHLGGGLAGPNMHWDYKDQLQQTDLGGGAAFYVYDASGQRVRKVWEKAPGLTEERIYLGGFEIFRKHGGPIGANTATLERETLHVMDDKQRNALVETRTLDTVGNDPAPRQPIRYQFGNHLGSAILELDEQAQIITYQEYAPYGSSTYQAVRSQTETAKRYRYTGKERDEESGFYYHGARYYAAWLGRWTSCDPAELIDGVNRYAFVRNDPIKLLDEDGTQSKKKDEAPPKAETAAPPTSQSLRIHIGTTESLGFRVLRTEEAKKALVSGVTEELEFLEKSLGIEVEVDYSTLTKEELKPGELQAYLVSPDLSKAAIKGLLTKHGIEATDKMVEGISQSLKAEHGQNVTYPFTGKGKVEPGLILVPIGSVYGSLGEEPIRADQSREEFDKEVHQVRERFGRALSKTVLHEIGHGFGLDHTKDKRGREVISDPPRIMDFRHVWSTSTTKEDLAKVTFAKPERNKIEANVAKWLGITKKK